MLVPSQHAGAAVSGLHHGRRGVAPAPQFQLCVSCAGPCRTQGGRRAAVSMAGASVAQGAVCWVCGVLVRCMCRGLAGRLLFVARVALLACVGGLAFVVCVCLWWFPAIHPACLCIPNHRVSLLQTFWGFLLLCVLLHLYPPLCLFITSPVGRMPSAGQNFRNGAAVSRWLWMLWGS